MLYLWLKAFHIIAVVAWMASLLYLPRLFVYHAGEPKGSDASKTFKLMERRLLKGIANPAMIATWLLGIGLAFELGAWNQGWLHGKLALVLLLSGFHGFLSKTVRTFAADENARPASFYRWINEVPTVALVGIVLLVVLKPF